MRAISTDVLPGVRLAVDRRYGDGLRSCYAGVIDALVAAGIASRSTLEPHYRGRGRPKGLPFGPPRVDRDGDRLGVVLRRGDWIRVRIWKPIDRARSMPGFSIASIEGLFADAPALPQKPELGRQHLRLVVDNTRRPHSRPAPDEIEPEHAQ